MTPVRVLVLGYGAFLIAVGAVGIFTPHWELPALFGLDPGSATLGKPADLLNQYRFLKAVELGTGVFVVTQLRSILDGGASFVPFLVLVTGGIAARSIAWVIDGQPSAPFIGFLVAEVIVLAALLLHRSRRHV